MTLVTTSLGNIINVDQVAMITVLGRLAEDPIERAALVIHFSATFSGPKANRSMRITLFRDEAVEFLHSLSALGVDVARTLTLLDEKIIHQKRAEQGAAANP